jgi:hypothetical protein
MDAEVRLYTFLTSIPDTDDQSASLSGRLSPGERAPGTHVIGRGLGPRTEFDVIASREIPAPASNRTPISQPVASYEV